MKALLHWSYRLSAAGAIISLFAMIASVVTQVYARFFLESAPAWTEEMARVFFIYSVAFGVGIGLRDGAFVRLDLIRNMTGPKRYAHLQAISYMVVGVFAIILIGYSWQFVEIGFTEKSPALEMNMGFVFVCMIILFLSLAIFSFEQAWIEFSHTREEGL